MQLKMFPKFYPPLQLIVVMMTMINVTVLDTAITIIIISHRYGCCYCTEDIS